MISVMISFYFAWGLSLFNIDFGSLSSCKKGCYILIILLSILSSRICWLNKIIITLIIRRVLDIDPTSANTCPNFG